MTLNDATADTLLERGFERLAAGASAEAARSFRAVIALRPQHVQAHHALVRALRAAGRLEESVGAALVLTVLTPDDPQAHAALAGALRAGGHTRQAETAALRARVLEWKIALQAPPPAAAASVPDTKR